MAKRLDGKMILWTLTLVVIVGFISTLTLLSPPQSLIDASEEPVAKAEALSPKGREPASINRAVQIGAMSLGGKENLQAVDLTIPCDGIQKTIFTQKVKQLRLKGNSCLVENNLQLKSSTVQNAANGFSATVFYPSQKSFTTDYISLADGINRIVIRHQFANGKVEEREYVVEREVQ